MSRVVTFWLPPVWVKVGKQKTGTQDHKTETPFPPHLNVKSIDSVQWKLPLSPTTIINTIFNNNNTGPFWPRVPVCSLSQYVTSNEVSVRRTTSPHEVRTSCGRESSVTHSWRSFGGGEDISVTHRRSVRWSSFPPVSPVTSYGLDTLQN